MGATMPRSLAELYGGGDGLFYYVQLPDDGCGWGAMQADGWPPTAAFGHKPAKRPGDEFGLYTPLGATGAATDASGAALGPPPCKRPATAERIAAHLRTVSISDECGDRARGNDWFFMRRPTETFEQIEERLQLSDEEELASEKEDDVPQVCVKPEYQELLRRQAGEFSPFIRQPSNSLALIPYVPPDEVVRPSAWAPIDGDSSQASSSCSSARGSSNDLLAGAATRSDTPERGDRPKARPVRRVKFTLCSDPEPDASARSTDGFAPPLSVTPNRQAPVDVTQSAAAGVNGGQWQKTPSPCPIISFPSDSDASFETLKSKDSSSSLKADAFSTATPRIQELFDISSVNITQGEEDMEL